MDRLPCHYGLVLRGSWMYAPKDNAIHPMVFKVFT